MRPRELFRVLVVERECWRPYFHWWLGSWGGVQHLRSGWPNARGILDATLRGGVEAISATTACAGINWQGRSTEARGASDNPFDLIREAQGSVSKW
jgi:hypothetical protein